MADTGGIRAGRAYVELGLSDNAFVKGLNEALQKLKEVGRGVAELGHAIEGAGLKMAALGTGIVTPLVGAAVSFAHTGEELELMSQRTGITVQALSELKHAATLVNVSTEDLGTGIRKMQKALADAANGSEEAQASLARIGLTLQMLKGLAPDRQFELIGQSILAISDPSQRAAEAMAFFGRSGTQLLPLFNNLNATREEAVKLGLTMTNESAEGAAKFDDSMKVLLETVGKLKDAVGSALVPTLTDWAEKATLIVSAGIRWVQQNEDVILATLKTGASMVATGLTVVAFGRILVTVGGLVTGFYSTVKTLGLLFTGLIGPIGAFIAAVSALLVAVGAVVAVNDKISGAAESLGKFADGLKDMKVEINTDDLDTLKKKQAVVAKQWEQWWTNVTGANKFQSIPAPGFERTLPQPTPEQIAANAAAAAARASAEAMQDREMTARGFEGVSTLSQPGVARLKRQMRAAWEVMGTFNVVAIGRQTLGSQASMQDQLLTAAQKENELHQAELKQLTEIQRELVKQGKLVVRWEGT